MADLTPGTPVVLDTPGNARLHGTAAVVREVTPWGAHVAAPAAATGRFRAAFAEMRPAVAPAPVPAGAFCDVCGSARMQRAGACLVCLDCGTSGGCG